TPSLIISAKLRKEFDCIWADDTRRARICIGINQTGKLIKWRSCRVRCRVRQGRVHAGSRNTFWAEKHVRGQSAISNATRLIATATIKSPKWDAKRVSRQAPVAAETPAGALPEIGDDHNIGLVIASAGFQPCFPFTHVVGRTQVCITVTASDLQS